MKPVLTVSVAVWSLVCGGFTELDRRRYGCIFTPDICIPPENCDGMTGFCQVPASIEGRKYDDWDIKRLVSIFEAYGHGIDNGDRAGAYSMLDPSSKHKPWYGEEPDKRAHNFLELKPQKYHDSGKQKRRPDRSVWQPNVESQNVPPYEYERIKAMESKRRETYQIKKLVDEVKSLLKSRGKSLSDLSKDEIKILAKNLAKMVRQDNSPAIGELSDSLHPDSPVLKQDLEINNQDEEVEQAPQDASFEVMERDSNQDVGKASSIAPAQSKTSASKAKIQRDTLYVVVIVVGATVLLIILVTIVSCIVYSYRTKRQEDMKIIRSVTTGATEPFGDDYQDLCRQHYARKNSEVDDDHNHVVESSVPVQEPLVTRSYPLTKPTGNGVGASRNESVSGLNQAAATRNSSVSSMSWSEEPVTANLDITTGHAVLSYMEDHLNNKNRLDKEWEEICGYEADNVTTASAVTTQNSRKNRSVAALPYDHNRIKLNPKNNHVQSDYINASSIIDNDPKRPLYIAAQGPLPSTIPDFWQMMWEQDCVAIVMLTPLVEEGVNQCARYWPDEGSCTYSNFEIHLVSEHIWCEDYLVRSLYLKHLGTGETRTVTQFHFLSWPKDRVPSTPKPLLELRRKVTKCYKGHNSPVLVHCSEGIGRTGTYILLDLAIDRMLKGAKEIDIAATLEHIRDQRVGMVATKEQFEFALMAVAEEVNAILKTLLH